MLNTELTGVVTLFLATLLLSIPLGRYIARTYAGERTWMDPVMGPVERWTFRSSGIDAGRGMTWKEHLKALMTINLVWFFWAMALLMNQSRLPWNPDGNPDMSADLAFNTAISFVVNCNLQHYSGETGASYFSQVFGMMFLQFVSAATGMAALAVVFNALKARTATQLGNFHDYFVKSLTRILLPLSLVVAALLLFDGTPMTTAGKDTMVTLQGDTVDVSRGPVAGFVAIKHIGTNGGGFFGANGAHPLENPSYFTNMVEMFSQMIIPFAMVFAFGFYLQRRKMAVVVFAVMTAGFLALVVPNIILETRGNPAIAALGIDMGSGAMEGKETRIGAAATGYWSIATTVISTGSVNSMHDSNMPLSGMNELLAMMTNAFYGGVGVGILNFFIFIILAVFISGLMVGRTPELFGKKIEAREMKIAMVVALLHPLLILVGTALAAYGISHHPEHAWLNNPGAHGLSEMLYEYTSSAANNGSGFEGLGDNTPWWNISTGIVLWLGRFIPIIGPVAIAGSMAGKHYIPDSAGTLKTDTGTFGVVVLSVIAIVAALSFFPVLALGPIAESLSF